MEKIQAAIAKARADRMVALATDNSAARALDDESGEAAAVLAPAPPPEPETPESAWLALPAFTPKPKRMRQSRILALEPGPEALPFGVIRTRMLQQMQANGWRRIGITSPGPGCGKSVLALNLAFSLARQADQRTILIEADLRRPSLNRYLGLKPGAQVARVLEGTAPLSDHAVRYGTNLILATQSGPQSNPAELLQSSATKKALDAIAERYEPTVMLFDLPPLMIGDDVMAVAGTLDAMLIVAAAETTTIKQIDHCERELAAQVNVMGVILNKCRYTDETESYAYRY